MEIKELLIKQLKENFNSVKVYDEPIQQGLITPCFIIDTVKSDLTRELGDITHTHVFVFMTYYPSDTDTLRAEFEEVTDVLYSGAFKYLQNKHHIHKLEVEANEEQRVMVVSFSLDIKRITRKDGDKMKEMKGSVTVGKENR